MVLIFAEVHPFGSVTAEPIMVDIVLPDEATRTPKKEEPLPEPKAQPSDAFDLSSKSAPSSSPAPAAPQAAAAQPQKQAVLSTPPPNQQQPAAQLQSPPPPPFPLHIPGARLPPSGACPFHQISRDAWSTPRHIGRWLRRPGDGESRTCIQSRHGVSAPSQDMLEAS